MAGWKPALLQRSKDLFLSLLDDRLVICTGKGSAFFLSKWLRLSGQPRVRNALARMIESRTWLRDADKPKAFCLGTGLAHLIIVFAKPSSSIRYDKKPAGRAAWIDLLRAMS